MLKSALITAATAFAISAGAFGISSASAEPYRGPAPVQVDQRDWQGHRGPGWNNNRWHGERHVRGPVRVCKPILRTVKVRGYHGWHFERIVVGERCHFVRRGW